MKIKILFLFILLAATVSPIFAADSNYSPDVYKNAQEWMELGNDIAIAYQSASDADDFHRIAKEKHFLEAYTLLRKRTDALIATRIDRNMDALLASGTLPYPPISSQDTLLRAPELKRATYWQRVEEASRKFLYTDRFSKLIVTSLTSGIAGLLMSWSLDNANSIRNALGFPIGIFLPPAIYFLFNPIFHKPYLKVELPYEEARSLASYELSFWSRFLRPAGLASPHFRFTGEPLPSVFWPEFLEWQLTGKIPDKLLSVSPLKEELEKELLNDLNLAYDKGNEEEKSILRAFINSLKYHGAEPVDVYKQLQLFQKERQSTVIDAWSPEDFFKTDSGIQGVYAMDTHSQAAFDRLIRERPEVSNKIDRLEVDVRDPIAAGNGVPGIASIKITIGVTDPQSFEVVTPHSIKDLSDRRKFASEIVQNSPWTLPMAEKIKCAKIARQMGDNEALDDLDQTTDMDDLPED